MEVFHLQCNYLKDLYKSGELELIAAIVFLAVTQNLSPQAKYQNKVQQRQTLVVYGSIKDMEN